MATIRDAVEKLFEDIYPHVGGVAASVAVFFLSDKLSSIVSAHGLKIDQAYSGIFGLATVLTGFLFTFYSFVITTDHGFIGKARSSRYLQQTAKFTVTALIAGGVASLTSLPMMVWQPKLNWTPGAIAFSLWAGVAVWSCLAFERAARLFIIFCSRHSAGTR